MDKPWKRMTRNIEEVVLSIFFVNMCVFVVIQIVSRYLFQNPWLYTEEVARFSYVWITFFGMSIATKSETHICVDIMPAFIHGQFRLLIKVIVNVISLFLYATIAIVGMRYVIISGARVSPAMEISMAFITISLPLGAIFSIVRLIAIVQSDITKIRAKVNN